jgi:hypothetical protein
MENWLKSESERLSEKRVKDMELKGFRKFLKLSEGTTKIEVDVSQPPREKDGKYGKQYIFPARANKDSEVMDLPLGDFTYELFVKAVENESCVEGWVSLTVTRVGTGSDDTRWAFKGGW